MEIYTSKKEVWRRIKKMKESIENLVKQLKENDFSAVKIKNYTFDATAVDFYSLDDLMRFCKSQNVNNIFYSKLPDSEDDFVSCEFFAPWNGVLLCYSANTKSIDDEMKSQIKADFGYSKTSDEDCFEDEEEDYDDEDEEDGRPITSLQEEINSKYQSLKRKIDSYSMCAGENCEHLFDDENNLLEKKYKETIEHITIEPQNSKKIKMKFDLDTNTIVSRAYTKYEKLCYERQKKQQQEYMEYKKKMEQIAKDKKNIPLEIAAQIRSNENLCNLTTKVAKAKYADELAREWKEEKGHSWLTLKQLNYLIEKEYEGYFQNKSN